MWNLNYTFFSFYIDIYSYLLFLKPLILRIGVPLLPFLFQILSALETKGKADEISLEFFFPAIIPDVIIIIRSRMRTLRIESIRGKSVYI